MRGLYRYTLIALLAAAAVPAWAQDIALSFTGSGNGKTNVGTGSGTLTPGGTGSLNLSILDGKSDCSSLLELTFHITAASGDTLDLLFLTKSPDITAETPSATLTAPLNVIGGTGAYSAKGGSGAGTVAVTFSSEEAFTYTFTGSITMGGAIVPVSRITPGGIVPVGGIVSSIAPGSWVAIYGQNFVSSVANWDGKFPTSLGGVSVTVDDKPAYLSYVGPTQINIQAPDSSKSGCVAVRVTTPNGTFSEGVALQNVAPAFLLLDAQYVIAEIYMPKGDGAYGGGTYDLAGPVGRFSYATRPVKRGETVQMFGVGFGPTVTPVPAGQAFSGGIRTAIPVNVSIGRPGNFVTAPVPFAGLISAGLYQINVTIPNNAPIGEVSIVASVGPFGSGAPASPDLNLLLSIQP